MNESFGVVCLLESMTKLFEAVCQLRVVMDITIDILYDPDAFFEAVEVGVNETLDPSVGLFCNSRGKQPRNSRF